MFVVLRQCRACKPSSCSNNSLLFHLLQKQAAMDGMDIDNAAAGHGGGGRGGGGRGAPGRGGRGAPGRGDAQQGRGGRGGHAPGRGNAHQGGGGGGQQGGGGGGGQQGGGVGGGQQGNVQQGNERPYPYDPRLPIALPNLSCTASAGPRAQYNGLIQALANDLNPFVSLVTLMTNPAEPYTMKVMPVQILSIAIGREASVRGGGAGNRGRGGSVNTASPSRFIRVKCPFSPAGSNTATIFEGNNHNRNIWSFDLPRRDDGTYCEFIISNIPSDSMLF